ncbi:MAG: DNA cytosine methyltransferase [Ignavibacteriales bacterium]|nr:DNA cytosine methyltransferase [Ignavibacteriales bacterium]
MKKKLTQIKPTVLDLFSGCGGLSLGFEKANYQILIGIDNWKDAILTFDHNHKEAKGIIADLNEITPKDIAKRTKITNIDIIVGGPPCQGFSIAGKRIVDDERNKLYKSFVSFVEYYKPKAFLMENVPNLISMGEGIIKQNIITDFSNLGYYISYKVILASEYGVPQNRRRAFFVGLLNGRNFVFPKSLKTKPISSAAAISDLPEVSLVDGEDYCHKPKTQFQREMRINSFGVFNHKITNHTQKTISIISQVPDGGNYKNLPPSLRNTRKVNIAWTRLNSKKPSFTIDTGHRHHFHYQYNRIPTVRESARLQSFPDYFVFLGSKTSQYKQVGNAVPPQLGYVLAKALRKFL